jgi:hypothetical protein
LVTTELSPNGPIVPPLRDRIAGMFTNQLSHLSRGDFRRGCNSVGERRYDVPVCALSGPSVRKSKRIGILHVYV